LLACAAVAGAVCLAFAGSALPAQAAAFGTNGAVGPVINFDGQCLDLRSIQAGAQAQVEPCNGQSEQRWAWQQAGSRGGFLLRNERWNRCLTILNHFTGAG